MGDMITIDQSGDFKNTFKFLNKATSGLYARIVLEKYGIHGVKALSEATPRESGRTANSWYYDITSSAHGVQITWSNSNIKNGTSIALLLQYGHGTGTGGYVTGIDYINPAMKPVFDKIAEAVWKEVNS